MNDTNEPQNEQVIELPAKVNLTDAEKLDFYKAFLADKPFEGEIPLFNGAVKARFRTLTVQEAAEVFEVLRKDQATGEVTTDSSYMMMLTNYRLANSLIAVNDEPFLQNITREKHSTKEESYLKVKVRSIMAWPIFKLSAYAEAFKQFEDKVQTLTNEIQTENFWAAVK